MFYNNYSATKLDYIKEFENLWLTLKPTLPVIETNSLDEENIKASIYNIWLNFSKPNDILIPNSERQFLYIYQEQLLKKINNYLWDNERLQELFNDNKHNPQFLFRFSYLLRRELCIQLDHFSAQHEYLKLVRLSDYPYYFLSDLKLNETDEIYHIIKILTSEFVNKELSIAKIQMISIRLYNDLI